MKFGGASLADAASIAQAVEVVRLHFDRDPVVVVSAHAGVTDALLEAARSAAKGDVHSEAIELRHRRLLVDLGLPGDLLEPLLAELRDLLRGIRLIGVATPRILDHVMSLGERCSARVLASALARRGIAAEACDAWDLGLRTDSAFGRARPLPDDGRTRAAVARCSGVPVVTGFIAKDEQGNITTLGRNGSDHSAAWFGAALSVAEIQIWKDVDGVRTADPRCVPEALPVPEMTFDEATELSAFGSKVLHPATMAPARQQGIPVVVRNTRAPQQPGTRIVADCPPRDGRVRAIAHRGGIALLTITAQRLLPQHTLAAQVFGALDRLGVDVLQLAWSPGAMALSVAAADAQEVAAALGASLEIQVERGLAVVGIIGDPPALAAGGNAAVLELLAGSRIAVRRAGSGARGSTFAVVIDEHAAEQTVRLLHGRFFQASRSR